MSESPPLPRRRFLWLTAALGSTVLGIGAGYWYRRDPLQQRPYPPTAVGEHERCPVCGMYPARFPRWQAQLVLKNGERLSFDSLIEVFRYQAKNPTLNIGDLYVSDYGEPTDQDRATPRPWLPATEAFFVHGSSLKGPMGDPTLPAFSMRDTANRFIQIAGGRALNFLDLTPALIQTLILRQH